VPDLGDSLAGLDSADSLRRFSSPDHRHDGKLRESYGLPGKPVRHISEMRSRGEGGAQKFCGTACIKMRRDLTRTGLFDFSKTFVKDIKYICYIITIHIFYVKYFSVLY
jgi:hypothetical protein